MFSRVERVDRVEILCRILDLIHQSWTVDLLQKGLTLLLIGKTTLNNQQPSHEQDVYTFYLLWIVVYAMHELPTSV